MIYIILGYLGLCVICVIVLAILIRRAPTRNDWD